MGPSVLYILVLNDSICTDLWLFVVVRWGTQFLSMDTYGVGTFLWACFFLGLRKGFAKVFISLWNCFYWKHLWFDSYNLMTDTIPKKSFATKISTAKLDSGLFFAWKMSGFFEFNLGLGSGCLYEGRRKHYSVIWCTIEVEIGVFLIQEGCKVLFC